SGVGPGVRRFWEAIAPTIPEQSLGKVTGDQQQPAFDRHSRLGVTCGLVADTPGIAHLQTLALERPTQSLRSDSLRCVDDRNERDDLARLGPPRVLRAGPQQDTLVAFVHERDG